MEEMLLRDMYIGKDCGRQFDVLSKLNVNIFIGYRLWSNACLPQIRMLKRISQAAVLGGGPLGNDWITRVEPRWMGLVLLLKETPEGQLAPPTMRDYREESFLWESGPSPDTRFSSTMMRDFKPPQLWERNVLVLFLLQRPNGLKLHQLPFSVPVL